MRSGNPGGAALIHEHRSGGISGRRLGRCLSLAFKET